MKQNKTSRYHGVGLRKSSKKYTATIALKNKSYHLGCYNTETEAAKAYDVAAKLIIAKGIRSIRLNFPDGDQNDNNTDYRLIALTQGKFAKVDPEDYEAVNQYAWHATKWHNQYYAARTIITDGKRIHQSMHEFILGKHPDGLRIDHFDIDGLNNTRTNLRFATSQQNSFNKKVLSNKAVPYKGVDYRRSNNKFRARIKFNGKEIYLGTYDTPEEAAFRYNCEARLLFKEFAKLNS